MKFHLLCAFRNRREKTLGFLEAVTGEILPPGAQLVITMFDDGSSDGTASDITNSYPEVQVIQGDGTHYWNGAMTSLVRHALQDAPDALILANDDIALRVGSLASAVEAFIRLNEAGPTVFVGAFTDPDGRETTYSGFRRRSKLRPLALEIVEPDPVRPLPCDTFNGNFVIVPAEACRAVGGLDEGFIHAYGDLDLGYRLRARDVVIVVGAGHMGACGRGPNLKARVRPAKLSERYSIAFGPHRSPRDHARFALRHAPLLAPLIIAKEVSYRARLTLFGK